MECARFVKILDRIFKIPLAEQWDNVGLLMQPSSAFKVKRICLTNDLTESVLDEAISMGSNFIISYHPPIFRPLKRLTQNSWKERIVIKCLEHKIAVYSPHTALDGVSGGINDWLLSPFGKLYYKGQFHCTDLKQKIPIKRTRLQSQTMPVEVPISREMQEYCIKNSTALSAADIM